MIKNELIKFRFIEAMILEYGECKRVNIMRCFDIETAAASRIRTAYNNASGNNIVKGKVRGIFKAVYLNIDAKEFLAAAQIMATEKIIKFEKVLR